MFFRKAPKRQPGVWPAFDSIEISGAAQFRFPMCRFNSTGAADEGIQQLMPPLSANRSSLIRGGCIA
jgi:hypothetical protein